MSLQICDSLPSLAVAETRNDTLKLSLSESIRLISEVGVDFIFVAEIIRNDYCIMIPSKIL